MRSAVLGLTVDALHAFPLCVVNVAHHSFQLLHRTDLPEELDTIIDDTPARVLPLVGGRQALHYPLGDGHDRRAWQPSLACLRGVQRDVRRPELLRLHHLHQVLLQGLLGWLHELRVEGRVAALQLRYLLRAALLRQRLGRVYGSRCPGQREAAREEPVRYLADAALAGDDLLAQGLDLVLTKPHHRQHLLRLCALGLDRRFHDLAAHLGQLDAVLKAKAAGGAQGS
mmetsp:Transcript_47425/g.133863  ORF Transcript_47425/g.133863 Transcript_47425/m.133863 type:complete len:227 (-) Transcript_47425:974-1654(-)